MDPADADYIAICWLGWPHDPSEASDVPSYAAVGLRDYIMQRLLPEVIGFTIYTFLFGELLTQHPSPSADQTT
jgi:hypothetical protein